MGQVNYKLPSLSVFQWVRRITFAIFIFILLGFFQVVILIVPFRIYARRLENNFKIMPEKKNEVRTNGYARLIGRLVARMARITPWPSKCLVQAMTVKFLLRRFKIANKILIGITLNEKQKLSAHAWVNVADITVVGGANSVNEFKVIKIFRDSYGS